MGYICCLGRFIEPSKSLGGKYEPSEKFRGQKQILFFLTSFLFVYRFLVFRGAFHVFVNGSRFSVGFLFVSNFV
jgi:hypothetical protein